MLVSRVVKAVVKAVLVTGDADTGVGHYGKTPLDYAGRLARGRLRN